MLWILVLVAIWASAERSATVLSTSPEALSFSVQLGLRAAPQATGVDLFKLPNVGVKLDVHGACVLGNGHMQSLSGLLHSVQLQATSEQSLWSEFEDSPSLHEPLYASSALTNVEGGDAQVYWMYDPDHNSVTELPQQALRVVKGKHVVLHTQPGDRLAAELALMKVLVQKLLDRKHTHHARILYMDVFGCTAHSGDEELLTKALRDVTSMVNDSPSVRPLLTVQFVGDNTPPIARRRQLSSSNVEYVIMGWTGAFLIILVFFVFCCIPWAPTLDPALMSTFKADLKQD